MRILVTGASGFLGSNIARALAADGMEIHALLRSTGEAGRLTPAIRILRHDGETEQIAELIAQAAPTLCIHTASCFRAAHLPPDIVPLIDGNLRFGTQLLDGLTRAGCGALINFGTSWQHFHTDEDDPDLYRPVSLYAATKQAFEALAAYYADARGLRFLTLKLSDTYGPDDPRGKLVAGLEQAVKSKMGKFSLSPGEQDFNLVHVDDVVGAVRIAIKRVMASAPGVCEAYSVRGSETMTLRQFVDLFSSLSPVPLDVTFGARPYREREVMRAWTGQTLPGWTPSIDLCSGIKQLLADGK